MILQLTHTATMVIAAFAASLVEFVEAMTIILAVGISRGWRSSLSGAAAGLGVLLMLVLGFGPLLTAGFVPLKALQIAIGILLLLFGLRWLRKAILRAAGRIPMHDEALIFERKAQQLGGAERVTKLDLIAAAVSMKAVLIEGIEVVFIILAVGAAETSLIPASLGAVAALVLVMGLGIALRRPLTRIPENTLKFGVAVILTGFGTFWIGEGAGLQWPGEDLAIPSLILAVLALSLLGVAYLKRQIPSRRA